MTVADLNDLRPRNADGMVVAVSVRAMDNRLVLHAGRVRQLLDLDRVRPGEDAGSREE